MTGPRILPLDERYQDYLGDESCLEGQAESLSFPETEAEVQAIIAQVRAGGGRITVQGGRTGLNGSAVPRGGHVLNLSRMNRILDSRLTGDGRRLLTVEPGLTLADLEQATRRMGTDPEWFWPPDPTESLATVGGVVSCPSRGLTAHRYGPTRSHVQAARVVDAQGRIRTLERGRERIPSPLPECQGDLLDLYLGAEGMLGVLTELTLVLVPRPPERWGIGLFFTREADALALAEALVQLDQAPGPKVLAAADYLDGTTLRLIEAMKPGATRLRELPELPPGTRAMIYLELHGPDEAAVVQAAATVLERAMACHVDPDTTWAVSDPASLARLRAFRHAATEAAHDVLEQAHRRDPRITRLALDLGRPGQSFGETLQHYGDQLRRAELPACLHGSVLDPRLQVQILADTFELHQRGQRLFQDWARAAAAQGLPVRGHGVGKLKQPLLALAAPRAVLEEARRLKRLLDPEGFWNPGNLFTGDGEEPRP